MRFSKKQIIILGLILLIIISGVWYVRSRKTVDPQNTVVIKRGNVTQEVSVTGRVKPSAEVELGFEKNGRVVGVYAKTGARVVMGQVLAEVESSSARGTLLEAEARLAEIKRGSRPEELAVKKAELAKYTQDLENAYSGTTDLLSDTYTKNDDVLHVKLTGIFSGYKASSYKYTFSVCDSALATIGENFRSTIESDSDAWRTENNAILNSLSHAEMQSALSRAETHLQKTLSFLETINKALTLDCTSTNSSLDTYRTNVNIARTNIVSALSSVNSKKQALSSATLAVLKVKNELSLLEAGSANEVIAAQEARVLVAKGELSKYQIVAPISGVVTKVDTKAGESAVLGKTIISIITDVSYKIEAYVPEADIAKIKIGNNAQVTLDAYGSDVFFNAQVTSIDPAETTIDNVPTYKTTLHFSKSDSRIKSGMTANIDIRTSFRENVLLVPERAVVTKDGLKYLQSPLPDGTKKEILVTLGLKGSDGNVEIKTGGAEGDVVYMSPKE